MVIQPNVNKERIASDKREKKKKTHVTKVTFSIDVCLFYININITGHLNFLFIDIVDDDSSTYCTKTTKFFQQKNTVSSQYLKVKVHLKLLISLHKFSVSIYR